MTSTVWIYSLGNGLKSKLKDLNLLQDKEWLFLESARKFTSLEAVITGRDLVTQILLFSTLTHYGGLK